MARKDGKDRGVFERPKGSGIWWVRYSDQNGREHREKVGPKTLALDVYRKRKTLVRQDDFFPELVEKRRRRTLVADMIKEYLKESKASKRSWKDDARYGEVWTAELGDLNLEEVRPVDIERWRRRKGRDASTATVNRHLAFLKTVFNVAIRDGLTSSNPVAKIKMARENNARTRFLLDAEEDRLKAEIRPKAWPLVAIDLGTGLRREELFTLRWEYLNLSQGVATIPRSKHGEVRHVPLSEEVIAILRGLPSRLKSQWVFPSPVKGKDAHAERAGFEKTYFRPALEKAGIKDFRFHDLRHTFASRLVIEGVPLPTVQKLMGHKTIAMTMRYVHLSPGHEREAVERLSSRKRIGTEIGTNMTESA